MRRPEEGETKNVTTGLVREGGRGLQKSEERLYKTSHRDLFSSGKPPDLLFLRNYPWIS